MTEVARTVAVDVGVAGVVVAGKTIGLVTTVGEGTSSCGAGFKVDAKTVGADESRKELVTLIMGTSEGQLNAFRKDLYMGHADTLMAKREKMRAARTKTFMFTRGER